MRDAYCGGERFVANADETALIREVAVSVIAMFSCFGGQWKELSFITLNNT